ncbi:MAG: type 1 glutamine amidotransferase domain-containing protein [Sinimarinibacterium flocculans]|uniref:type 1 glutamine amidotransferase domain-containing protein n=1 Tax=Sinimarinibacterium flocculans TaxID=985250 RepID=UPI003C337DB5
MAGKLEGKRIAILATEGFEQSELFDPKQALEEAGALTDVISPMPGSIRGWKLKNWGDSIDVDTALADADPADYDALLLPGGVINPDHLRTNETAVAFVKACAEAGKPIAAICHGPWTLIDAGVVRGRRLTSWPSLRTDLINAGAEWVDAEVVTDDGLVTSRKPDDLPAFIAKMIEEIVEGQHSGATA